jgi:hypothetical protein
VTRVTLETVTGVTVDSVTNDTGVQVTAVTDGGGSREHTVRRR